MREKFEPRPGNCVMNSKTLFLSLLLLFLPPPLSIVALQTMSLLSLHKLHLVWLSGFPSLDGWVKRANRQTNTHCSFHVPLLSFIHSSIPLSNLSSNKQAVMMKKLDTRRCVFSIVSFFKYNEVTTMKRVWWDETTISSFVDQTNLVHDQWLYKYN